MKQSFALEPGGPKRLQVSWGLAWKEFTVRLDGQVVGTIPTQKELWAGREFALPDGSTLSVRLAQQALTPVLELRRNGAPLPGSGTDPGQQVRTAAGIVYFLAGFNIVIGIVALIWRIEFLLRLGVGVPSIVFGLVFAVLGFFVQRRSALALGTAMALLIVDMILSLAGTEQGRSSPPVAGLVLRILFLIWMWQGFAAMRALRRQGGE